MLDRGPERAWVSTLAAVVLTAAGCAVSNGFLPMPEQLANSGLVSTDTDMSALRRGRALVVTRCADCHRMYWPHEYSSEEWRHFARSMGELASMRKTQIRDLQLYLQGGSSHRQGIIQRAGSSCRDPAR